MCSELCLQQEICISSFVLHASAVDIIWEARVVVAQLWPVLSLLSSLLRPPLSRAQVMLRVGGSDLALRQIALASFFSVPLPQPEHTSNPDPTTLLSGASRAFYLPAPPTGGSL